jgi:hypothetical protein
MAQIFHPSFNTIAKGSILGVVVLAGALGAAGYLYVRSSTVTGVYLEKEQPIQFSHEHHFSGLGIDCRYCHTSVETSSFAGLPPTKTCMTCHSQVWVESAYLAPVRESYQTDKSLRWTRVHNLADFVYFNHSVHLKKGIGCESCHGRVDRMQLMAKANTLQMEWCLDCHRDPSKHVRPRDKIYEFGWKRGPSDPTPEQLMKEYDVQSLTYCSTCHR